MRILAGILAALLASVSFAQSVNEGVGGSWVAPVNDANGIPLAGSPNAVTSYNVYASTTPLTAVPAGTPLAVVTAPATTVTSTLTATVGQTLYLYVTACNAAGCSDLSAPGTKVVTIPAAKPGVPTSVTITITVKP